MKQKQNYQFGPFASALLFLHWLFIHSTILHHVILFLWYFYNLHWLFIHSTIFIFWGKYDTMIIFLLNINDNLFIGNINILIYFFLHVFTDLRGFWTSTKKIWPMPVNLVGFSVYILGQLA
jgi:hypothetical protein